VQEHAANKSHLPVQIPYKVSAFVRGSQCADPVLSDIQMKFILAI
jgi:hypothetical protein